ncbi:hypothetical protein VNO77_18704 [Canavalia gladiata]|uniref:Uncharacterized protein n=1 Tax=Canavalia gladiata TaxID=3824 RepID=A0AAN9QHX2_CANGL
MPWSILDTVERHCSASEGVKLLPPTLDLTCMPFSTRALLRHAKERRNFVKILSLTYHLLLVVMVSLKGPTRGIGVVTLWRPRGSCLQRSHAHGEVTIYRETIKIEELIIASKFVVLGSFTIKNRVEIPFELSVNQARGRSRPKEQIHEISVGGYLMMMATGRAISVIREEAWNVKVRNIDLGHLNMKALTRKMIALRNSFNNRPAQSLKLHERSLQLHFVSETNGLINVNDVVDNGVDSQINFATLRPDYAATADKGHDLEGISESYVLSR